MDTKKYYKHLDLMRIIFCIAILFYHLNILKGGYLAVCSFFTLSGYLSCISALKKEKFSLKEYYLSRLKKIYIPLLVVVFISIPIVLLLNNINWINLKPEVTSIIFNYNNFWQLSANLDYFARHVSSPFMHLWYVSILIQFEIIFPFIFMGLKKIADKTNKKIPILICIILGIASFIGFALTNNIMVAYYNTFTRMFSILLGLSLGFIHHYYKPLIPNFLKKKPIDHLVFIIYSLIFIILYFTISADSSLYKLFMLLTTLITCRLIDYSIIITKSKLSLKDSTVKWLSSISYEIYLVQYPVIFLFQYLDWPIFIEVILIIIITLLISIILNYTFSKKKNIIKLLCIALFSITSIYGFVKYVTAEDHTKEMKELEHILAENEEAMRLKQLEYKENFEKEQEKLQKLLEEYTIDENKINEMITNLSIVGVGDSIMKGAVNKLSETFPNGYFDAEVSRSGVVISGILQELKNQNLLGDPIVINICANGGCNKKSTRDNIMKTIGSDREVFWLTVTNDYQVNINDTLKEYAEEYENLHIIDWEEISMGHEEYFYADGLHLTATGQIAYSEAIYNAVSDVFSKKFNYKREEILKKHEEELKSRYTFYGNDLLINIASNITIPTDKVLYLTNKNYTFKSLKEEITNSINNKTLNYKVIFAFDNQTSFTKEEYEELIELCNKETEHEIYIVSTSEELTKTLSSINNINIIDFYQEIKIHDDYLMIDKVHLTNEGNIAISNMLSDLFNPTKKVEKVEENISEK